MNSLDFSLHLNTEGATLHVGADCHRSARSINRGSDWYAEYSLIE
jgi:hypothetical protein